MDPSGNATNEANGTARDRFPIVAVGASAGGLSPTVELLRGLGAEPSLALVIIHHLDPTHESGLVDILSRATAIPVMVCTDALRIEANHVYVVPPNAGLLIGDGVLKVVPRVDEGGLHLPIDRFFESLAVDRGGLAVGVVLSGSGFDGTEGVRAIKREGGITAAQDASAAFRSMPESAIATGCVDFVLPPSGLAGELARMGAHAPSFGGVHPVETGESEFPFILAAMRKASGVDFASYKHSTIRRRVQRRLFLRRVTDLAAYAALLASDPDEIAVLCEEVLIHVTGFFREPEAFEAIHTDVLPKICEDRSRDAPIRVWVPGCSTGEEVYSIAICMLEFLEATQRAGFPVQIFGTDLSLASVEKARAGRYPERIEGDISPGRLRRFFTKDDAGYRIQRGVRDMCVFAKHDVTRDPPFSAMDLVSCRNVMIYLGPGLQDRLVALLHYALKETGFLVLGNSETLRAFPGFAQVDGKNKIYARTSAAPRLTSEFVTPTSWRRSTPATVTAAALFDRPGAVRASSLSDVHREADRLTLAEFAPPGVVVTSDLAIVQFRGQTGPFLEPVPGAASLDLMRMVREEVRLPLRRAIERASATQTPSREPGLRLGTGERSAVITLEVIPFAVHAPEQRFFLVLFQEGAAKTTSVEGPPASSAEAEEATDRALQRELASTRQYLESVIEQLEAANEESKAANEEIVSSNEELRSTNEELQSAKEELQASNEELRTINEEMAERNVEATRLNDDLTNVLNSVEIPMLIVGRDLRLRRFTPAAGKVFGLTPANLRRPLSDAAPLAGLATAVGALIPDVIDDARPAQSTIRNADGRWCHVSVRPYLTIDGRIEGSVITARDVDAETRAAERLEAARKLAQEIVDALRAAVLVLRADLRVHSVNAAFVHMFRPMKKIFEGTRLDELEGPALANPLLKEYLEGLVRGKSAEDLRLEYDDDGLPRVLLVNARPIADDRFLVTLEDVTEIEHARAQRLELGFRDALTNAAEAILMIDGIGRIVFANHKVEELFGFLIEEVVGQPLPMLVTGDAQDPRSELSKDGTVGHAESATMKRDLVGRRKNGTEFPIEFSTSTMTESLGSVVLAFVTDVTQRRAAEREIRNFQARLQAMAFDGAVTEEQERRRIATELHDGLGQDLALLQIKLEPVRGALAGSSKAEFDESMSLIERIIGETRTLVFDISPPILYDLGLREGLAWLAEDVAKRYGVAIEVTDDGADKPLNDVAKGIVFRGIREAIMNVIKHAKTPTATVSLARSDGSVHVDVEDCGIGFDFDPFAGGPSGGTFGLLSVREQVRRLGGTLSIRSSPKEGTVVTLSVPLVNADAGGRTTSDPPPPGEAGAA